MLECGYLMPNGAIFVEKPGLTNIWKIDRKLKEWGGEAHISQPYSKTGKQMPECGYLMPNGAISVEKPGLTNIYRIIILS